MRCREIGSADLDAIADLLTQGFGAERSRAFWCRALARLSEHATPSGFPRYGYLLESGGAPVGVILLIFTDLSTPETTQIRCNVSSWYVQPEFRAFGSLLISRALKRPQVTYLNVTPAPHTLPLLQAQGYKRYCEGVFVAVPMLSQGAANLQVIQVGRGGCLDQGLLGFEMPLLLDHARQGCLSVVCRVAGRSLPFVFALRRKFGLLPVAVLVYCRGVETFVEVVGGLGRYLAVRGIFLVVMDANGPVPGLSGRYRDGRPKYFKGASRPTPGDLAYTEVSMFGV